jgi:hypothetical protein
MTTHHREFRVTVFPDKWARTKSEIPVTVPELVDLICANSASTKARLPLLKLASFGDARSPTGTGCLRWDGNVKLIYGVEIDYDGEVVAFDEAFQRGRMAGVLAVLYTSPSHRPEAPRWRALCPFAGAMLPAERRGMALRAGAVLGVELGPDSLTLSQSYYFGRAGKAEHFRIEIVGGDPVDTKRDLRGPEAVTESPVPLVGERRRCAEITDYGRAALTSAAQNILNAKKGEQEITLNREGYTIGQAAGAGLVPVKLALEVLELAAREIPNLEPARPWRGGEVERKIRRAFDQGYSRPRPSPNELDRDWARAIEDRGDVL